jgi:hypothetical protein
MGPRPSIRPSNFCRWNLKGPMKDPQIFITLKGSVSESEPADFDGKINISNY